MQNNCAKMISKGEKALLEEIREIGYGELQSVKAYSDKQIELASLTSAQNFFIDQLRQHGFLDRVIVHQGEPAAAEIAGITESGYRYVRKLKF